MFNYKLIVISREWQLWNPFSFSFDIWTIVDKTARPTDQSELWYLIEFLKVKK